MKLYQTEAIICGHYKLGETDRILSLYTQSDGIVRAVAKGVRKGKSKYGGRLEPLSYIKALIYRGKDLHTLTEVDLMDSFREVREDYDKLMAGSRMLKLTERLGRNESHPGELFPLLLEGFHRLSEDVEPTILGPVFDLAVLHQSGFLPSFDRCCACSVKLDRPSRGFSVENGGLLCESCVNKTSLAYGLTPEALRLLRLVYSNGLKIDLKALSESAKEWPGISGMINAFLQYHLDFKPLML